MCGAGYGEGATQGPLIIGGKESDRTGFLMKRWQAIIMRNIIWHKKKMKVDKVEKWQKN